MTDERLREIEERAREATKGPWKECAAQDGCGLVWSVPVDAPIATTNTDCDAEGIASSKERKLADAAFIAAAREDVPELIEEVHRLREQGDAMAEAILDASNTFNTFMTPKWLKWLINAVLMGKAVRERNNWISAKER